MACETGQSPSRTGKLSTSKNGLGFELVEPPHSVLNSFKKLRGTSTKLYFFKESSYVLRHYYFSVPNANTLDPTIYSFIKTIFLIFSTLWTYVILSPD